MADPQGAALTKIKGLWMTGATAWGAAPAVWRDAVGQASGPEAELRLVAIAGQALQLAYRPAPPPGLAPRPDLPVLALETLPDALRPLFRRSLGHADDAAGKGALLRMMAGRGYGAHPVDWLPGHGQEAPEVYGPWRSWLEAADQSAVPDEEALMAGN